MNTSIFEDYRTAPGGPKSEASLQCSTTRIETINMSLRGAERRSNLKDRADEIATPSGLAMPALNAEGNHRKKQQGWTLIEVLVAVVILTVGLLAVGTMQISAIRGNFMGGNTSTALNLASQKMEDLFNQPYADVETGGPEQVTESGGAGGFYRRDWEVTDPTGDWPEMKEIIVTVRWQSHRVTLQSMRRQDD